MPGGGLFYSRSVSPDFKIGLALTGNFGSVVKYDEGWVGRYRAQEGTLLGFSILPSAAWRVNENLSVGASLNAMVGKLENKVAVNNIIGSDGSLKLDDNAWGFGANVGLLYEIDRGTRFRHHLHLAGQAGLQRAGAVERPRSRQSRTLLASRGLLDANVDLGVTVPQGVNASFYHEIDPRWAVLGSVGWQQWSRFGEVEIGVDSKQPRRADHQSCNFKDTWHVAAARSTDGPTRGLLNAGIAYDSGFQDNNAVALALPANAAWRFGVGAQKEESKTFNWGLSFVYLYGGNLHANVAGSAPVALGGRGDVVGSFNDVRFLFLAANFNWKF